MASTTQASATVNTINIIAALIGLFGQYGPALVKGISDLMHQTPQGSGEADGAYIARIYALTEAKLADAQANDAAVEAPVVVEQPVNAT